MLRAKTNVHPRIIVNHAKTPSSQGLMTSTSCGLAIIMLFCLGDATAGDTPAGFKFPRSTPEAQGVDSSAILDFVEAVDEKIHHLHSLMIIRNGHVVAEGWWSPYDATTRHHLFSLSKSFTSTAAGFAISEGHFTLDDRVLDFFPEDAPKDPSDNLRSMRVRDLLTMTTGQRKERFLGSDEGKWTQLFLEHPVEDPPGKHFRYNTSATYMVSAIIQKRAGQKVVDYLQPRLFEPLGIHDPKWDESPQGVSLGGYGLSVRTEDIARFGQLYLQDGRWKDEQLLPPFWAGMATTKQMNNGNNVDSDWNQGYGFQFWRCRHNCFRGDGLYGQFCIVIPEKNAVIATTSGASDMGGIMQLVWDKVLPAMKTKEIEADIDEVKRLKEKLASLTIPPQQGAALSPTARRISGNIYQFGPNDYQLESIGIVVGEAGMTELVFRTDGQDYRVTCGHSVWSDGKMALANFPEQPVGVTSAWTSDDVFTSQICFRETPYILTLNLKFTDNQVTIESSMNLRHFRLTQLPTITGNLGNE